MIKIEKAFSLGGILKAFRPEPLNDNDFQRFHYDPHYREQIEDVQFLLEKMHNLVVLEYRNGMRWHSLHPMVADFLIRQGVIESVGGK